MNYPTARDETLDCTCEAKIIVAFVTAYPPFAQPSMHAGIDLARALVAGDVAITQDAVLVATIADTFEQLKVEVHKVFR